MWIFSKYGFYSAVCARKNNGIGAVDTEVMMVRARSKKHIENLKENFKLKEEILETPNNDYRYRIFVPKQTWAEIMSQMVNEVDYDNFKNKVKEHLGEYSYLDSLADVWSIMYQYQNNNE